MPAEFDLRYPIGKAENQPFAGEPYSETVRQHYLSDVQHCPRLLEIAVLNLDIHQLDTPYRDGGWTVKQVVHHVADSHMNAYIRFKLALTESNPVIKPYDEAAWAQLNDTHNLPVNISLTLLHALHLRWVEIMRLMSEAEWHRTVFHPEQQKEISLWNLLASYAWHGKHHVAHITALRERMGWN